MFLCAPKVSASVRHSRHQPVINGRPEQDDGGRRERHLVDRYRDGVLYFASLLAYVYDMFIQAKLFHILYYYVQMLLRLSMTFKIT